MPCLAELLEFPLANSCLGWRRHRYRIVGWFVKDCTSFTDIYVLIRDGFLASDLARRWVFRGCVLYTWYLVYALHIRWHSQSTCRFAFAIFLAVRGIL